MNNKVLKLFCLGVLLTLHPPLHSSPNTYYNKGETKPVSPFTMQQEKQQSVLQKKYDSIENLYKKKNYSEALKQGLELLAQVENIKNKDLEYSCNMLIANIFSSNNNHKKSLEYYKRSIKLLYTKQENFKNEKEFKSNKFVNLKEYNLVNNLLQIGSSFQRIQQKDSAVVYYHKMEEIDSFDDKTNRVKALAYSNLSGIYLEDSLFNKSKIYALKAVEVLSKLNDKVSEAAAWGNLASIYLVEKNYKEAKITYSKALDLIEKDTSTVAVKYKEGVLYNLAYTLFLLKDYMAYDYQERSYIIKDNLRDQEMRRIVEDVYAKHQVSLTKNQVELKRLNDQKTTYYLTSLIVLLFIVFGVIIYNYKLRQNNLRLTLAQNDLAQQSKLEKMHSESQTRILNATLDGKESERKEIAETLHDSVSTLLSSANLHLQASKNRFKDGVPLEIQKSQHILTEASQKIRDLSHTLVSSVLLKFGLHYAINEMGKKYSNSQIEIKTETKFLRRYQQNFEIKVNNILQEFVNNILKHSKASLAKVSVIEKKKELIINIEDNGCGFDTSKTLEKDGLGLNQIEARILVMKGVLDITSEINKGTQISVVLPIIERKSTFVSPIL